jgi:hypothetical protein
MLLRVTVKPSQRPLSAPAVHVRPISVRVPSRAARVLDFDLENRPLSYLGSDFTTGEVTAIAWSWCDKPRVTVRLLGEVPLRQILSEFVVAYNQADMVTGHYITGHDLPMINGALVELGMPILGDKLVMDTKTSFIKSKGISLSQESIGAMLRLDHSKVQMNQVRWRAANRLTKPGLKLVRERVVGDVQQHIEMFHELTAKGYLGAPRMWRSGSSQIPAYTP